MELNILLSLYKYKKFRRINDPRSSADLVQGKKQLLEDFEIQKPADDGHLSH